MGDFERLKASHALLLSTFAGYGNDFARIPNPNLKAKIIAEVELVVERAYTLYADNINQLERLHGFTAPKDRTLAAVLQDQNRQLRLFQQYWLGRLPESTRRSLTTTFAIS